jgi:hypothetical protein
LIVPKRPKDTPHAVRELAALDPALDVREPAVLWLDDIDAYLFAGDLEVVTLDRLRAAMPDLLLLGTIRKGKLADLRALERKRAGRETRAAREGDWRRARPLSPDQAGRRA